MLITWRMAVRGHPCLMRSLWRGVIAIFDRSMDIITTYGYDNQGNRNSVSSGGVTTNYNFDAENQLLQVSGMEGYAYDATGRRVAKTALDGPVSDYYFYDQAGQLMSDYNPTTAIETHYFYVGTKLVAKHATMQLTAPTNFTANPNVEVNQDLATAAGAAAPAADYVPRATISACASGESCSGGDLAMGVLLVIPGEGEEVDAVSAIGKAVHGNSAASNATAYLYRLTNRSGDLLK